MRLSSRLYLMSDNAQPNETDVLNRFDFALRTRLIFGANCIEQIGELARQLGSRRVLLVTDAGIVAAGHADRVRNILEKEQLAVSVFDEVRENPTTGCIAGCLKVAKENQINAFIGLGGGSAMDTAKGCNFILTNGGEMNDYWGVGKATKAMLPMIAIPTTAGTGSECQSAALIADEFTHEKMACLDEKAAPKIALLDPTLTLSQPARVTAATGVDALAHALESAVTKKRSFISQIFSREAFRLCVAGLPRVLENPNDLEARGKMLLGAAFAGIAIENSMLGAAHSAANPLTAAYGIVHGEAVGMMLPHVVCFNGEISEVRTIYANLAIDARIASVADDRGAWLALIAWINSILEMARMPRSLTSCEIKSSDIPMLAEKAAAQWTAQFNPRDVNKTEFERIYRAAC